MLGWKFFITQQREVSADSETQLLATWMTGINGTDWLSDLVSRKLATDLGGNGYPDRYLVPAEILKGILIQGPPPNDSPFTIGDYYVLPSGWTGAAKIDTNALSRLDPDQLLLVEAWDQS